MQRKIWIVIILVVILVGGAGVYMYYGPNMQQPATTESVSEKVFTEVSGQFGFTRAQVLYFTVYGDDRVQYNAGEGLAFAYKDSGVWHISGPVGSQEVPPCSLLIAVPEKYRQACWDETAQINRYIDPVDGQNINYPTREAVRYMTSQ